MTTLEKKNIGFDVLSSNVFNLNNNTLNLQWRNLSNEKRIEILNRYFESDFNNLNTKKKIDNDTINIIIDLVSKGKLKLKKEITYDKINERIIKINALTEDKYIDLYVYKPELLIKKEKSKKLAKNILFRKK